MSELPPVQLSPEDAADIQKSLAPLQSGMMKAASHSLIDFQFQKLMESCNTDPQLSAKINRSTDEFCRLHNVDTASIGHLV